MSDERARQFVELYGRARVDDQRGFYERRAGSFRDAYRQLLLTSAAVFGLTAAVGVVSGLDVPGKLVWAVLAAVLPAITTVLTAYEGLYAFQRIAKLYGDAARNLRLVEPPQLSGSADEQATVARYVAEVERVLANERGQWGQLAVEAPRDQARG